MINLDFSILNPTLFYFLLPIYSTANFYLRKFESEPMYQFSEDFDFEKEGKDEKAKKLIEDKFFAGIEANIFSLVHIVLYLYIAYSFNIFSALVLLTVSEFVSFFIVGIEGRFVATKHGNINSIRFIAKLAPYLNVGIISIFVVELKLFD